MAKVDRYENFTATQLATDEAFIAWVKCPDARSDLFWRAYINRYPAQASVVAKARVIVNEMHVVQEHMEEERAAVIWRKINQTIRQLPEDKRMARVISMRHWWAVAAVLLLMVVGIWIFNREPSNGSRETAVTPKVQQDIRPGKDGAILTLADGRQIELESASNGSLAQQGASNIKKEGNQVVYHQQNKTPEVLYNTMSTPKGTQYALVLSDGSKVWLNAASSIRFPTAFTGDTRGVEITGEAYFEVAHNPGKPFIVSVNNMRVEVLGTHFNINAYSDEESIKTTLLQGSVKVSKGEKMVLLHPGQQAQSSLTLAAIRVAHEVNLEEVMAWKNGYFSFHNADIQTVMRQLARWYDVTVEYKGAVPERVFEGEMQRDLMLSQALKILEKNRVHFRVEGKKIVVFS